eukprot:TRINITY_DN16287_c0_g1_i1.p2 TRINITY_DN16287_c0_g1~~TRINITY_DN16287_c0_g1_i1.p2  ORF type:complete len:128 (-),score=7.22 TRINITY_DN16287_c0_g1_i1:1204-1587(-)
MDLQAAVGRSAADPGGNRHWVVDFKAGRPAPPRRHRRPPDRCGRQPQAGAGVDHRRPHERVGQLRNGHGGGPHVWDPRAGGHKGEEAAELGRPAGGKEPRVGDGEVAPVPRRVGARNAAHPGPPVAS